MLGLDTYLAWLVIAGGIFFGVFVAWFLIVTLFAPHIPYRLHTRLDCSSPHFIFSLHHATLSTVHHDSHFEVLTNANEFYPAMLEAIGQAQRTINLECYIFRPDETGRRFMRALIERARAVAVGVERLDMQPARVPQRLHRNVESGKARRHLRPITPYADQMHLKPMVQ